MGLLTFRRARAWRGALLLPLEAAPLFVPPAPAPAPTPARVVMPVLTPAAIPTAATPTAATPESAPSSRGSPAMIWPLAYVPRLALSSPPERSDTGTVAAAIAAATATTAATAATAAATVAVQK